MVTLFEEGKQFYKGNLHMHTTNTDGRLSPQDAVQRYADAGYDFICITDHWKRTTVPDYSGSMLVLPGIEVDYFLASQVIHIVGINVDESILDTVDRKWGPQRGIDAILAAGGLAVLAHPMWSLNTTETICSFKRLTAAEIFNSVSRPPWNGDRADATGLLDMAAANGTVLNTIAVDDAHFYNGDECHSFIRLQADELTPEAVMDALKRGAYYATQGPELIQVSFDGDTVTVDCAPAKRILFHSNRPYAADRCWEGEGITHATYKVRRDWCESFVRVIVEDENGLRAWANPIMVPYE